MHSSVDIWTQATALQRILYSCQSETVPEIFLTSWWPTDVQFDRGLIVSSLALLMDLGGGGWQWVAGPQTLLSRRGSLCTAVHDGVELPGLPTACHRQLPQADPLERAASMERRAGWESVGASHSSASTLTLALLELLMEVVNIINPAFVSLRSVSLSVWSRVIT